MGGYLEGDLSLLRLLHENKRFEGGVGILQLPTNGCVGDNML